jgi:hypothetical protein
LFFTLGLGLALGADSDPYKYWQAELSIPLGSAVSSFLGLLFIIGAFRSFRVHNVEATLLLVCFCFTLLTKAPIGEVIWPGFVDIGNWLMDNPNMMVTRAMRLVIGLGIVAWVLQIITGRERRWVGEVGFGGGE